MHGLAGGGRVRNAGTADVLAEVLTSIDGQCRQRQVLALRCAPRALGRVHAAVFSHRAVEHPVRQRCLAQGLAGVDVFLHPLRHLLPAGFLPQLEGALLDAETPAHREVDIARAVGHAAQVHGGIVEAVAMQCPQELRLRAAGIVQQLQPLGSGLLQDAIDDAVGLATAGHIAARGGVEALDVLADLLVETRAALLAQRARVEQFLQRRRCGEAGVERIGLGAQCVLQGLDDMRHRVQPHHVGRAEGAARGTAELLAGEIVDHVVA